MGCYQSHQWSGDPAFSPLLKFEGYKPEKNPKKLEVRYHGVGHQFQKSAVLVMRFKILTPSPGKLDYENVTLYLMEYQLQYSFPKLLSGNVKKIYQVLSIWGKSTTRTAMCPCVEPAK